MIIKITPQIKESIKNIGNKTFQTNALKLYGVMYNLSLRARPNGYFDAPSDLLKKVNGQYNVIIKHFLKDGIINYQKNMYDNDVDPLFGKKRYTKNYSTKNKYSMKYKILVDLDNAENIEVDIAPQKPQKWFNKIKYSLNLLGYNDDTISRDSFGRRIHYKTMYNYKTELSNKGLFVIDSITSQPRLLYLIMKERGIIDKDYFNIFENNMDFYLYLAKKLDLKTDKDSSARDKAKNFFMLWTNSSGYVPDWKIYDIFPEVCNFLGKLKSRYYKDSSAFLQREEAKIWIDDLLTNCPCKFALSVHDSLIVQWQDAENIKNWCQTRYPDLRFDMKEL